MKSKKGFTLTELLAVIAIIVILTIIAVPNVLKLYKESKKNTFITQVRKTAKSAQLEYAEGTINTFDCNKDLAGQKYKECTGTVDEDEVTITALGDGTFSNFLMVDVTSEPDSGVFIDLDELNLIEIEKEEPFSESLIKNGAFNSKFRSVEGKEFIEKLIEIEGIDKNNLTEEQQKQLNLEIEMLDKMRNNHKVIDNKFTQIEKLEYPNNDEEELSISSNTLLANGLNFKLNNVNNNAFSSNNLIKKVASNEIAKIANREMVENILIYELTFDSNMLGTYEITKSNIDTGYMIVESDLNKIVDESKFAPKLISEGQEVTISNPEKLYFIIRTVYGEEYEGLTIEKPSGSNLIKLIGNKSVDLNIKNIKSYKDSGIKYKETKLDKEGDFYSYNNIRERDGEFTYNYVVKTTEGVKILKRKINVFSETSLDCFKFSESNYTNGYQIDEYYNYEQNDQTKKACPKKVYIPDKYNNKNITKIEYRAFYDKGITSVRLPNALVYIGYKSFTDNFIESVVLPNSVKGIGDLSFYLNNITYVEYNGNNKFCYQDIGAQKYNSIYKNIDSDHHYSWSDLAYTGKTSGPFLTSCRPPE